MQHQHTPYLSLPHFLLPCPGRLLHQRRVLTGPRILRTHTRKQARHTARKGLATCTLTRGGTHTHTHTLSRSFSFSHASSQAHTHTHAHAHSHMHTNTLSFFSRSLSLTHARTHKRLTGGCGLGRGCGCGHGCVRGLCGEQAHPCDDSVAGRDHQWGQPRPARLQTRHLPLHGRQGRCRRGGKGTGATIARAHADAHTCTHTQSRAHMYAHTYTSAQKTRAHTHTPASERCVASGRGWGSTRVTTDLKGSNAAREDSMAAASPSSTSGGGSVLTPRAAAALDTTARTLVHDSTA